MTSATTSIWGKVSTSSAQASGSEPSASGAEQVVGDQHPLLAPPVDPGAGGQADDQEGEELAGGQQAHLERVGVEHLRTASTGMASRVSWVPNWLIVSPMKSWRKSWWWNRPPAAARWRLGGSARGAGCGAGGAGGSVVMAASSPTDWEKSISGPKAAIVSPWTPPRPDWEPRSSRRRTARCPVGSGRQVWARRPADEAEAKALASPLRLRILRITLHEPRTNKEIAEALGLQPGLGAAPRPHAGGHRFPDRAAASPRPARLARAALPRLGQELLPRDGRGPVGRRRRTCC